MRGYKVFKPDWNCRGFQYAVGETFEEDMTPSFYKKGFHFCTDLKDCFSYYSFNPDNKVAEIEALGEIDKEEDTVKSKHRTNKFKIIREISWEEVLRMVNTGKANTGLCNTGNHNSGSYNSGHYNSDNYNSGNYNTGNHNSGSWNSGYCNNGNHNSGDYNSGHCNSGNYNSGSFNSGNRNSGNWNVGDWNIGDWNKTSFSNGCFNTFNTKETKIFLFNKLSNWTLHDWHNSEARRLLNSIPKQCTRWITADNMSEKEKKAHPSYKVAGGYLKILDEYNVAQEWWDNLSNSDRKIIESIPNFDPDIFEECTGIKINKN